MRITLNNANAWLEGNLFADINLPPTIDKTTLKDTILDEYGDYRTRVSDPTIFKRKINNWFEAMRPNFERIDHALSIEYNPIENYDKMEDNTNTNTRTGSDTNLVSAFDATTYSDSSKDITDHTATNVFKSRVHGNVGVTKAQDMLKDEIDIRSTANIYMIIADAFFDRWLIHVL